jgi:hypothetical protein
MGNPSDSISRNVAPPDSRSLLGKFICAGAKGGREDDEEQSIGIEGWVFYPSHGSGTVSSEETAMTHESIKRMSVGVSKQAMYSTGYGKATSVESCGSSDRIRRGINRASTFAIRI